MGTFPRRRPVNFRGIRVKDRIGDSDEDDRGANRL
jgi:hypothetical protein